MPRPPTSRRLTESHADFRHVAVDFELNGCPINKMQMLEVLTSLLHGRAPHLPAALRLRRVQAPRNGVRDRWRRGLPAWGR